jgi:GT2 family glycosyltransferase
LIVVDDCSGDETARRAEALGARVISHAENRGRSAARNTGLRAAQHDWVALLDSDDEWLTDHLETLWAARSGRVLVGCAALAIDDDGRARRTYGCTGRRAQELRSIADVALPENKLVTSAVMLRRQAALAAGGFREGMERAEDLELWGRMLHAGTGLAVPRVTALYHLHEQQISADAPRMWDAHASVLSANGSDRAAPARRAEGVRLWDEARSGGAPWAATVAQLVASPQRAVGVAQLLATRRRARRAATAFTSSRRS